MVQVIKVHLSSYLVWIVKLGDKTALILSPGPYAEMYHTQPVKVILQAM